MREVIVTAVVDADPDEVYRQLSNFPSYVGLAPSVRSVEMSEDNSVSRWEVTFRDGVLRWAEADRYDPVARRLEFEQIDGDLEVFEGVWAVVADDRGAHVSFTAAIDLGLPGLAEFLEPVAQQALLENIAELIASLFAGRVGDIDARPVDTAHSGRAAAVPR